MGQVLTARDGIWGRRVRLTGGYLAHWAGPDQQGCAYLAHGDFAWSDRLRPAPEGAPECKRCARNLAGLEHKVRRGTEEGIVQPR